MMKIAVGLRMAAEIYDREYLQFLVQVGVTHVIVFMPHADVIPSAALGYWDEDGLKRLVRHFNDNGLQVDGVENFIPVHWDKMLLGASGRETQMENIKRSVAALGGAGIPTMGYNFSLGGVIGMGSARLARGGAQATAYDEALFPPDLSEIPLGMVWNTVVDPNAPTGNIGMVPREEVFERLCWFLERVLPVAEEAGVCIAGHPEDPPNPIMRQAGRWLVNPEAYDRLFKMFPSKSCGIEFCQGTFTEMPGVDVYQSIEHFASQKRIAYVHLRNVRGELPKFTEVLIDEGDVDMARALRIYHQCGYEGSFIPDHYPRLASAKENHAILAYCVGYMRGLMQALDIPIWEAKRRHR